MISKETQQLFKDAELELIEETDTNGTFYTALTSDGHVVGDTFTSIQDAIRYLNNEWLNTPQYKKLKTSIPWYKTPVFYFLLGFWVRQTLINASTQQWIETGAGALAIWLALALWKRLRK